MKELQALLDVLPNYMLVLIGAAGSGKSTVAGQLSRDPGDILSSDHLRYLLTGDAGNQAVTQVAFDMVYTFAKTRVQWGQNMIIDATNLKRRDRKAYYELAQQAGIPAIAILVKAGLEACSERQASRERKVPVDVIERHVGRYGDAKRNVLSGEEPWAHVFEYDTEEGVVTKLA